MTFLENVIPAVACSVCLTDAAWLSLWKSYRFSQPPFHSSVWHILEMSYRLLENDIFKSTVWHFLIMSYRPPWNRCMTYMFYPIPVSLHLPHSHTLDIHCSSSVFKFQHQKLAGYCWSSLKRLLVTVLNLVFRQSAAEILNFRNPFSASSLSSTELGRVRPSLCKLVPVLWPSCRGLPVLISFWEFESKAFETLDFGFRILGF